MQKRRGLFSLPRRQPTPPGRLAGGRSLALGGMAQAPGDPIVAAWFRRHRPAPWRLLGRRFDGVALALGLLALVAALLQLWLLAHGQAGAGWLLGGY